MIKFILGLMMVSGAWAESAPEVYRPGDRFHFIGDFSPGNPFEWDTDTISSNVRVRSSAVVFELDQGVDVEIRDVTVLCRGGQICDRIRDVDVNDGRPTRIHFRRELLVEAITVRARPRGFSVPPPRVNVYLEVWDGW